MGMKEREEREKAENDQARMKLEADYSRWQGAVFHLNQILQQYVASPNLRDYVSACEEVRHIVDPFLKSRKQLDRLVIRHKSSNRAITLEAQPLWPPRAGSARVVEIKGKDNLPVSYYLAWDGQGDSPNFWWIRLADRFNERLNDKSFDKLLESVFFKAKTNGQLLEPY